MSAELKKLESGCWLLVGQVTFVTAEALAVCLVDALPLANNVQVQQVDIQQASGGSALLLVCLAWQRHCLALGLELQLLNPSIQLQKVAELSHLQNLLPWVFNTKHFG
ncbi:MAG TPA: hypothetical protein VJY63_06085 [Marinospirillum sp.]|uniref:hypothetical protein n=1 Tax=Marinospirillum sp. TaxID=2183934 RepID=UPI002B47AAF6|nr:hypothetical protein [Marinospirillum sp.]HKM15477.1 hypothetical protein [Marinospirillum sp.]